MKKQSETIILNQTRDLLRIYGWFVIRFQQGLGCHRGLADLLAIKDGQHVFIEVKTPKGKQSENQIKFQKDVESVNGRYIVVRSLYDLIFHFRLKEFEINGQHKN